MLFVLFDPSVHVCMRKETERETDRDKESETYIKRKRERELMWQRKMELGRWQGMC